ncbi:membrane protease YdiL (CAAX protease family) [Pelomonas saccharophila]|uniref:Membrane protease YdiL (CAAX protease family) n=1 Tax=Roseateles saccharophilus TaxID=304 RepID=A0ABU1YSB3_ROSSA|nr:CPBP family glutamic-type intramembrane protease [Roseateles saccharophilus]MDR7271116.1 membrane protease YdiL (CAAX protease family) [Roseateles saccharophilus]
MPPSSRDTFPNAFEAAFLVACLFAVEFLIGAALYDARSVLGMHPNDLMDLASVLGNGLLLTGVMHWSGMSYGSLFHPAKSSPRAVMGMLALPILCVVPALTLGITAIEVGVVALFPISRSDAEMFERMTSGGLISILMTCLVAPVVEEMLFRGVILRSFLRQYQRWPAILGTALLFGLVHMNIYQCVAAFITGTLMGWLYERTRSLWPSILLHASYNSAVMFGPDADSALSSVHWLLILVLAVAGTVMLRRLLLPRTA